MEWPSWTSVFTSKPKKKEGLSMQSIRATPYWMRQTLKDLLRHEGFREYAYPDPLSYLAKKYKREKWGYVPAPQILGKLGESPEGGKPWTVGIGYTRGVTAHHQMGLNVAMHKLEQEVLEHLWVLDKWTPGWQKFPDVVKSVLANMAFNMGSRLLQFKATARLLNAGDFAGAGRNLKASAWYKQVGQRAVELTTRLQTGQVRPEHRAN